MPLEYYDGLEIVLAGFHSLTPYSEESTLEQNTQTILNVIKNGKVDILAHLGNPKYPLDYEKVVKYAAEKNVAIEINNSSFEKSRKGSEKNCLEILKLCKKYGNYVSIGSDTHFSMNIGNFSKAYIIFEEVNIDENKILNSSFEVLDNFLKSRR